MAADPAFESSDFQCRIPTTLTKVPRSAQQQEESPMLHESYSTITGAEPSNKPAYQGRKRPTSTPDQLERNRQNESTNATPPFSAKRGPSGDWSDRDGLALERPYSPAKKLMSALPVSPSYRSIHTPLPLATHSRAGTPLNSRSTVHARTVSLPGPGSGSGPGPESKASKHQHARTLDQPAPSKSVSKSRVAPAQDHRSALAKQPPCQEISQRQLAQEITAIYKTLVQIEAKCVGLIAKEFGILRDKPGHAQVKQDAEHWQALIALHRTLLHEHHDFFLASQHPSSGSALREIATKYSMPARMWKHGIHNFLELLRRHLPLSMEFMLAFIYLAYQMMALLFETVPGYKDTWIECLGDLARYRMAIEEEDLRDREIWTSVAKMWYCKAMGRSPRVGRLQHHLAILARTNAVEQLSLYARSLAAEQPFASTRGSIMTLIEPMLARRESVRQLSVDTWYVKVHGIIITNGSDSEFAAAFDHFSVLLEKSLEHTSSRWREQGAYICIANAVSCLGWGQQCQLRDNLLDAIAEEAAGSDNKPQQARITDEALPPALSRAQLVFTRTLEIVLAHSNDPNTYNHIFLALTFLVALAKTDKTELALVCNRTILERLVELLNKLLAPDPSLYTKSPFVDSTPLPEEWSVNAQIWHRNSTPADWLSPAFEQEEDDESRRDGEDALKRRKHRLIWMGKELQSLAPDDAVFLRFADDAQHFTVGAVTQPAVAPVGSMTQAMEIRTRPQQ